MTEGSGRIRLGALPWPQYTDWEALRAAGIRAEELGYDSLWTWDHLYPIVGSHHGPMFEGYLSLAGWVAGTSRIRIGLMVGANPFRNPALVGKLVTQLDHMSGGRMICGIGAAWFEEEHHDFGFDFGASVGERLRWLEEAVVVLRGMFDGAEPSGTDHYATRSVRNDPPPIQAHLPILVGGGGERKTLRIVAQHADANNLGGGFEKVRRKEEVLLRHCAEVGRDPAEIERTANLGVVVIRDTEAEARRVLGELAAHNGGARAWPNQLVGTPEQVAEELRRFAGIGYRHVIGGFPAPFDGESMERLAGEVRPMVEAAA
ncbi:MAG TPA: LLM class flavin-dependent oxidoreductase [Pleomorphomonadaceae bacterium]|nr:LLM class flavin-dependent oxidoreductase [Pleomorphomonadaceae bacterium]